MIDINLIISLVVFYFVMYVTPGPNNTIVLSSGLQFGFIKTIPVMAGITAGHVLQLVLVCLGLGKVFHSFPQVQTVLKILCSVYILYLGYRIIGSISKVEENEIKPVTFSQAAIFQIVNPKAWTISSMAASSFLAKDVSLYISIPLLAAVSSIICPISISPWAAFGSAIRKFISNNRIKKIIEYFLAILLFITAILIIFQ